MSLVDVLRELIEIQNPSYHQASDILSRLVGNKRGLSQRTIRRLCAKNHIGSRSLLDIDRLIILNVAKVYYSLNALFKLRVTTPVLI